MKEFPIPDATTMLGEGVIDNFSWQIGTKEEAEKLRHRVNMSLLRRELSKEFNVTVVAAIKTDNKTVIYFVHVEKKANG